MRNFLTRILQPKNTSSQSKTLEEIRAYSDNLEFVPPSPELPEHLVAHGIIALSDHVEEIRTAIKIDGDGVEFSTNVGQIPNNTLGLAVTDNLNHRYVGKFVTFDTDVPDNLDVVYATRKPSEVIDPDRLSSELETHALTMASVGPILSQIPTYGQDIQQLDYRAIRETAKEIVDSNLDLQRRLLGLEKPIEYISPPLLRNDRNED
jgi:hypothetical protein